jgi:hypothetical protein
VFGTLFAIFVASSFFLAFGGAAYLFPAPQEDPELSQLYRVYVIIEPQEGNFTEYFFSEITIFNHTDVLDKFDIKAYENTSMAKASGYVLLSLNLIDGLIVEIESQAPTDIGFNWYNQIISEEATELSPSTNNMWGWEFIYRDYTIKVQLGPRMVIE